jgi:release factor glutamine methyltransferase
VLIPRPETELLVEQALPRLVGGAQVLDIGTGSGALAIALASERSDVTVTAIDVSPAALAVAAENARCNGVAERIRFAQHDLARLPSGPYGLIVANPPYIPSGELATLMPEVRDFEPRLALDGGSDGLAAYRAIAAQAGSLLAPGGWLLVEIGADQAAAVRELFVAAGLLELFTTCDLAGIERVVGGRKS